MKKHPYYDEEDIKVPVTTEEIPVEEFGCYYCWDNYKKKDKELFFLDAANNMRICDYCPACGRKF